MLKIDLREIRKSRLEQVIAERFGGRQIDFSIAAKRNPTQVNQWLSGHRNPNGDTCRSVEAELKLPQGWLDQPSEGTAISLSAMPADYQSRLAKADAATLRLVEMALYEDDDEAAARLTPSLVAMVRALKVMIADQGPQDSQS